jgi:hypothetical protein
MRGLELTRGKLLASALSAACAVFVLHAFGVLGRPGEALYDSWLYGGLLTAAIPVVISSHGTRSSRSCGAWRRSATATCGSTA